MWLLWLLVVASPIHLRLACGRHVYASSSELTCAATWSGSGRAIAFRRSRFSIRDSQGRVVFTRENAFLGRPRTLKGAAGASNVFPPIDELPAGRYRAMWEVDDWRSNEQRFEVTREHRDVPPLEIELVQPSDDGPYLIVHVTHRGPGDLARQFPELLVDGAPASRPSLPGSLAARPLAAGESFATILVLSEYDIPTGRHQLAVTLGDLRSAPVAYEKPLGSQ